MAMTSPATSPDPTSPQQQPQPAAPMYFPPAAGQYAYPPQPPKREGFSQKQIAIITVGVMVGAIVLALVGALVSGATRGGGSPVGKDYDARMVSCGADGGQYDIVGAQAVVEVVNKTSRTHSYTITVAFTDESESTQYATGTASISDLAPGQTGRATATSWQGGNSSIKSCKVIRISQSLF